MVSHDLTVIGVVINELKWVLYIEKKGGGRPYLSTIQGLESDAFPML